MSQIEMRCGLVEQKRFGLLSKRRRKYDDLSFASRQGSKVAGAKRERVGSRHRAFDCGVIRRRFEPSARVRSPAHQDYLFRGERKLDVERLRQERHPPREVTTTPSAQFGAVVF